MSASMARRNWLSLLKFGSVFTILYFVTAVLSDAADEFHNFFLCRKCGCEILEASHLINVPTKLALRQRNDTFGPKSGVLIQLFKNPHGAMFEVVTATRIEDIYRASEKIAGDTWWSGYFWRILGCPQCRTHIGWEYIPMDETNKEQKTFYGLVLNNLLYENEAFSSGQVNIYDGQVLFWSGLVPGQAQHFGISTPLQWLGNNVVQYWWGNTRIHG